MSEPIETNPDEDMVFIASPPAEGIDPKASHFNFGDLMRWVTDPDTGDTAMHVAARMGRLDIINAAWQHFWQVIDWDKVPDKPGSEVYAPIDYDLPEFEIDVDLLWVPDYMVATVLFSRKNVSGHTTADEATTAGYTDVADRLNQALDRVTLGGKKATKSRMARMRELVNGRYDIDGHHLTWDQIPRVGLYYPPKYRS